MLITVMAACLAAARTQAPSDGLPKVPPPPHGVTLTATNVAHEDQPLPKGTFEYKLRIANGGGGDLVVFHADFWANHVALLKDADGRELPLTKYGKRLREGLRDDYGNRDHNKSIVLKPGEAYDYGARLDLAKLYDPAPGRYTLSIVYLEQTSYCMRIDAKPVPIVVLPDEANP